MDTRYERVLNQTKGFRLNFSEKDRLDVNDGEEGEFRINKSNGINNLYVKINKKWKSIQLLDPQTNIQGNVEQSDSYESLGMPPCNYDSDWFDVTTDQTYTLNHNLGSQILKLEVYFKKNTNIYNVTSESLHEMKNDPSGEKTGISLKMNTNDIIIGTAADHVFHHDVGSNTDETSGEIRLLAWKIQGI
jgi:hypothetical protein